ncbi:nuclear transport factor 2 family protein [Candidatus Poriferisodalis sp.]|uniref:nuclear transport factor 2 family protein n=1 Tax=Candidatus Poriferisodalis sp. TaxID=3101277 RepID=UPI003B013CCA
MTNDDRVEIRDLISRYNKAIDTGDADGYANTFTPDGQFIGIVGTFNGRDELRAFAAAYATEEQYADFASAQHWVTNVVVDAVEGDDERATVFSHLQMVKPSADGGRILLVGHYDDIVRRADDGWLFEQRIVVSDA